MRNAPTARNLESHHTPMTTRGGWIAAGFVAIAVMVGARTAASTPPPPIIQPQAIIFSPTNLLLSGVTGKDKASASFHLIAGKEAVKGITILPGDLHGPVGKSMAANSYQVTPATIPSLDPGQAVLVTVTAGPAPASGTYQGALRIFFQGLDPAVRLELPIEFKAEAKTVVEVSPPQSPLVLRVTRSFWPGRLGGKAQAQATTFNVPQKADGKGTVRVSLAGPLSGVGPDARPLPAGAVEVRARNSSTPAASGGQMVELLPGSLTTFDVTLKANDLPPGLYRGAVVVASDWDSVQSLPLEVSVRDPWVPPLLVLLLGFGLSFVVTYMATTGTALLQVYRRVDALKARLSRRRLLPRDRSRDWAFDLVCIGDDAESTPPAEIQRRLDAISAEMDQARSDSEQDLKTIESLLGQLAGPTPGDRPDSSVAALLSSPWVKDLRTRLEKLRQDVQNGPGSRKEVIERIASLDSELKDLEFLVKQLPEVPSEHAFRKTYPPEKLQNVGGPDGPEPKTVVQDARTTLPPAAAVASRGVDGPVTGDQTGTPAGTTSETGGKKPTLGDWFRDPRNYLPILSTLLGLLALLLLAYYGLKTLYAGKPTFGANWPDDYVGVFVWGLASEAGRKQVADLLPLLNPIQSRPVITPTPPAPPVRPPTQP